MHTIFTPEAKQDLRGIALYIARDNKQRAVSFINAITKHCHKIAAAPLAAPEVRYIMPGLRRQVFGRYLIFYRVTDDAISIARILHSARDIEPEFFS